MFTIGLWIIENKELVIALGVLLIVLSMTGNITRSVRTAKKGLNESITPLGFFIFIIILYIVYQIYLSIMVTL